MRIILALVLTIGSIACDNASGYGDTVPVDIDGYQLRACDLVEPGVDREQCCLYYSFEESECMEVCRDVGDDVGTWGDRVKFDCGS